LQQLYKQKHKKRKQQTAHTHETQYQKFPNAVTPYKRMCNMYCQTQNKQVSTKTWHI